MKGGELMMETISLAPIIAAVGQVGFPIVLTVYLLIRFEKKIDALSTSIMELIHERRDK